MFFSSSSNGFYSSNHDFTSFSIDDDILKNINKNDLVIFQMMALMVFNSNNLFTSHEMKEGGGVIYGPNCWCLRCLCYNVNHTNIIQEFDELYIVKV
jgi:hypothetical protein